MSVSRAASRIRPSVLSSKRRASHLRFTHNNPIFDADDCALPRNPTWSVDELLSSYPKPVIDSKTLEHLHRLSALTPPEEGTQARQQLTRQLEDLVKLVEAVKMVDTQGLAESTGHPIPDGRVWAEGTGIEIQEAADQQGEAEVLDQSKLLSYAARTEDGFYVVDTDRKNKN